jgi:3-oxoacyl-[acyl-carrier protein] reductase
MGNRLQGKVVAITGGSQGIGLAIAQRFAEEGADISFCYRSRLAPTKSLPIFKRPVEKLLVFNTTSASSLTAVILADTATQFGKIDVL